MPDRTDRVEQTPLDRAIERAQTEPALTVEDVLKPKKDPEWIVFKMEKSQMSPYGHVLTEVGRSFAPDEEVAILEIAQENRTLHDKRLIGFRKEDVVGCHINVTYHIELG